MTRPKADRRRARSSAAVAAPAGVVLVIYALLLAGTVAMATHLPPPIGHSFSVKGALESLDNESRSTLRFKVGRLRFQTSSGEPGFKQLRSGLRPGATVEVEAWPGGTWPQMSEVSFIGLSMEGRDLVSRQARLNYAYLINAGTWFLAFVLAWPPVRYYWRKHKERRDGSGGRASVRAGAEKDHRGNSQEQ